VNQNTARWLGLGDQSGLAARCLAVTAWMLIALLPVAWIGFQLHGPTGVLAASVAAFCCWVGALPPILVAERWRGPQYALHHVVVGMFSRMALPLALGLAVQVQGGSLSRAGFLLDLVAFFLVGLAYDTLCVLVSAKSAPLTTERLVTTERLG
jgi:hypothetical protein